MSIFRKKQNTTENLFLGNPEAESEGNIRAKVKLDDVFYDYLKVLPEIETEKFIGSPSSAEILASLRVRVQKLHSIKVLVFA